MNTGLPWLLNAVTTGKSHVADGIAGGGPGAPGYFAINGVAREANGKVPMQPDDVVLMMTPGGGAYGKTPATTTEAKTENKPTPELSAVK